MGREENIGEFGIVSHFPGSTTLEISPLHIPSLDF